MVEISFAFVDYGPFSVFVDNLYSSLWWYQDLCKFSQVRMNSFLQLSDTDDRPVLMAHM